MKKFCISNSLVLLALSFATPVHAWMQWSAAENLHPMNYYDIPVVALNDQDQAMVLWNDKNTAEPKITEQILAKLFAQQWQVTSEVSPVINTYLQGATLALNNCGQAIAAWAQINADNRELYVAQYDEGKWSAPQVIATIPPTIGNIGVVYNDAGDGVVTYTSFKNPSDTLYAIAYENGQWQSPQIVSGNLADGTRVRISKVVINQAGDQLLVWLHDGDGHKSIDAAYRKKGDATWSEKVTISQVADGMVGSVDLPDVALNDRGEALAVWTTNFETIGVGLAAFANGQWSAPEYIEVDQYTHIPCVALNNQGNAVVSWQANALLFAKQRQDGHWTDPVALLQDGWNCWDHKLAYNDAGHAIVVCNAWQPPANPPPFPPPPDLKGFAIAFAHGQWGTPQRILKSVIDVKLNQKDQAIVLGTSNTMLQARRGSF